MIQIRPSQLSDLDRLMEIFDHARKFMASVGNGNQWINGYPQRELIAKEITVSLPTEVTKALAISV